MDKIRVLSVCAAVLALTPCFAVYAASEKTVDMKSHGKIIYTDAEGVVKLYSEDISYLAQKVSSIPHKAFAPSLFSMTGNQEETIIVLQDDAWEGANAEQRDMDTADVKVVTVDAAAVRSQGGVDEEWLSAFEELMKAGKAMKVQVQEGIKDTDTAAQEEGTGDMDETEKQTGVGNEENAKEQTGVGDEENAEEQTEVGGKTDAKNPLQPEDGAGQGTDEDSGQDHGSISANDVTDS